ncbi:hypothetical protein DFP72DRAFT_851824 [Ephemerocybe angulata]|uniref:Uncharacterized protein n=1 Tax=Ephemerocybe angulata TaxID=980116 RepID=A0A8H6HPT5_9AGAR|nr:hypothetical protein DFP72DRAFT_851824 [Tulosesus angulatus]
MTRVNNHNGWARSNLILLMYTCSNRRPQPSEERGEAVPEVRSTPSATGAARPGEGAELERDLVAQERTVPLERNHAMSSAAKAKTAKTIRTLNLFNSFSSSLGTRLVGLHVYPIGNFPKAKAALRSSRTAANSAYCPPLLQAALDLQPAFSTPRTRIIRQRIHISLGRLRICPHRGMRERWGAQVRWGLKYMLLCKVILGLPEDVNALLTVKLAAKYAQLRDVESMRADQDLNLANFEKALRQGVESECSMSLTSRMRRLRRSKRPGSSGSVSVREGHFLWAGRSMHASTIFLLNSITPALSKLPQISVQG